MAEPRVARNELGLPGSGPGSRASAGQRAGAFVVDIVLSALVAALFTAPALPRNVSLIVFGVAYFLFTAVFGQTVGMRLLGIGLVRIDGADHVGWWRGGVRTVLLILLVPALIWDHTGRGLHDRFAGTVMVLTREPRRTRTPRS